jgi:hypothetical protein
VITLKRPATLPLFGAAFSPSRATAYLTKPQAINTDRARNLDAVH